ncbi:sugar phosphate isomerase/epimerase family protein [Priestia filamentosa]|uniref:sugar phosphate isomerase/epimerase family protein n=1 Tax=Priestia filamentosa TaxID=1402861 RepID=UPI00397C8792
MLKKQRYPFILSGLSDEAGPSIDIQIQAHLELGWREMEIRSLNGKPLYKIDNSTFKQIKSKLDNADFSITTVASCIGNWERPINMPFEQDLEELKILSERMHKLGTKYVRIMSYPNNGLSEDDWFKYVVERMHVLTEFAYSSNIVLLHENCSGWGGVSPQNTLHLLEIINNPALRLLFDIGNGIAYNYDSYEFLQKVYKYVDHVHVKDGLIQNQEVIYTLPGEGQSKVKKCLQFLLQNGYTGILSIEPHLHLIPHLKKNGKLNDLKESYINYGRHLETLLETLSPIDGEVKILHE